MEDVIHPSAQAVASEERSRKVCSDRFFTAAEMAAFLSPCLNLIALSRMLYYDIAISGLMQAEVPE